MDFPFFFFYSQNLGLGFNKTNNDGTFSPGVSNIPQDPKRYKTRKNLAKNKRLAFNCFENTMNYVMIYHVSDILFICRFTMYSTKNKYVIVEQVRVPSTGSTLQGKI